MSISRPGDNAVLRMHFYCDTNVERDNALGPEQNKKAPAFSFRVLNCCGLISRDIESLPKETSKDLL